METIDHLFTGIARAHLGIETLETRKSDRLDFHDVSVWGVKAALLAAYQAGLNDLTAMPAGARCREMREALERAEFLMRRVHQGDHHALENLPSAAKQARRVLAREKTEQPPRGNAATDTPIVAIRVEGGLIEDIEATISLHAVVEDWDVADYDTGKKPARSVWTLDAGMSASKAEKLRCLIADD